MTAIFKDREDAGNQLALELTKYKNNEDAVVLALPRGGVPVAYQIAKQLNLPLDVFIVRKLGVPHHKELAMGAIASGDTKVINENVVKQLGITQTQIAMVEKEELEELKRREQKYRAGEALIDVYNKDVILVDDGIATGATIKAAILALKKLFPHKIIIAVPVAAASTIYELSQLADDIICLSNPEPFYGVGMWYENFSQTTDGEVCELLCSWRKT